MGTKIDGGEKSQFDDWADSFLQIIKQIHHYETSSELNPQLEGLITTRDFEFMKLTSGVTAIKKTYDEIPPLIDELYKLGKKYPNAFRETQLDFLTFILKLEEKRSVIFKLSDGGKFTYNGRKALHGWIKREFDNIFSWVKNSKTRKEFLFNFLTDNAEYLNMQEICYEEDSINLPVPPKEKEAFDIWLRKFRSYNQKELEKILLKPVNE